MRWDIPGLLNQSSPDPYHGTGSSTTIHGKRSTQINLLPNSKRELPVLGKHFRHSGQSALKAQGIGGQYLADFAVIYVFAQIKYCMSFRQRFWKAETMWNSTFLTPILNIKKYFLCLYQHFLLTSKPKGTKWPQKNNMFYGVSIYASINYTAPCVMSLMRTDTLRGQVGGGWALEWKVFGPCELASSRKASAIWGGETRLLMVTT